MKEAIDHLRDSDPVLAEVMDRTDGDPDLGGGDPFPSLCMSIVYQQLSGASASAIWERFLDLVGGEPTPSAVLSLSEDEMEEIGLSRQKRDYLKSLASECSSGLDLDGLDGLDDEEVIERLTEIRGIGDWTARMFLMFTLGREDVFPIGDLGIRRSMAELYGIDRDDREALEEIAEKWRPYRSFGSWYIWQHGDDAGQENW